MSELKITPFLGIDNVTGEPNDPGWVKDAVNVDFWRDGWVSRRPGFELLQAGVTSVFGSQVLDSLVGVMGGELHSFTTAPVSYVPLGAVYDSELEYAEVNNELVLGGLGTLAVVRGGRVEHLGVEDPPQVFGMADAAGGLVQGRYGVLITYVTSNGEESAASAAEFIDVAAGGGIEIPVLPTPTEDKVTHIRVYRTTPNGEVFYLAATAPVGSGPVFLGEGTDLGRACDTRHKTRMRPGMYLRYFRGRLLVARGNVVYISEPLRYGLMDPRTGFVQFPGRVTFIQPVEGGVFVGQPGSVLFMKGQGPEKWDVVQTGAGAPIPGSATSIDGTEMSLDGVDSASRYAVWMSERGYAIGTPNGSVVEPQGKRLRVPVGQYGATVVHERRLLSLVS